LQRSRARGTFDTPSGLEPPFVKAASLDVAVDNLMGWWEE